MLIAGCWVLRWMLGAGAECWEERWMLGAGRNRGQTPISAVIPKERQRLRDLLSVCC